MFFRAFDLYNMVDKAGKQLTLSKVTGSAYDPATGTVTGGTTETGTFKGYLFSNELRIFGDDAVVRGNRTLVISSLNMPFEPEVGFELTGDDDGTRIVNVQKIMSGDTAVCYLCEVQE